MAANNGLVALLQNVISSREELRREVLKFVRDKHMSRKELVRVWTRLIAESGSGAVVSKSRTVKELANDLVDNCVLVQDQDASSQLSNVDIVSGSESVATVLVDDLAPALQLGVGKNDSGTHGESETKWFTQCNDGDTNAPALGRLT